MLARIVSTLCFALAGVAAAQQFAISTFAGAPLGTAPVAALNATIGSPQGVATGLAGNVYFSSLNAVFKLDTEGILTRVAGNLHAGYSGDGGPAVNAQLFLDDGESGWPVGLAIDSAGVVYIADRGNSRVRKVSTDGIITTVADRALLKTPIGLALDSGGNLYIADAASHVVLEISPAGAVTTVAGNGSGPYSGDGGPATGAGLNYPAGLAIDAADNLFIADAAGGRVRKVTTGGIITTVAGNGLTSGFSGDGGPATNAQLSAEAVAVDRAGNLYIADPANRRIRKVSTSGIITTIAGISHTGPLVEGGLATAGRLVSPSGVAVDGAGDVYISDLLDFRIRQISPQGNIVTVAGNGGCCSYGGDGGPAVNAQFNFYPWGGGLAWSGSNLFIADSFNNRIRRVSPDGIVVTVAGVGGNTNGFSGDGGPALGAQLNYPGGVAVDAAGAMYIADTYNLRLRKVSAEGIVTSLGPQLNGIGRAVTLDSAGNLYIGDVQSVRKLAPDGTVTTLAQTGAFALAVDNAGNLYFADIDSNVVREVSPDGGITTVAGAGTAGYSGDGGPANSAQLNGPVALAIDGSGALYIADTYNLRIRRVSPDGIITTVAGSGAAGYSGDGGPAASAQFGLLCGLAIDSAGNLYAADQTYNVIRLLQQSQASPQAASRTPLGL